MTLYIVIGVLVGVSTISPLAYIYGKYVGSSFALAHNAREPCSRRHDWCYCCKIRKVQEGRQSCEKCNFCGPYDCSETELTEEEKALAP